MNVALFSVSVKYCIFGTCTKNGVLLSERVKLHYLCYNHCFIFGTCALKVAKGTYFRYVHQECRFAFGMCKIA